jgi:hypothetical protein
MQREKAAHAETSLERLGHGRRMISSLAVALDGENDD